MNLQYQQYVRQLRRNIGGSNWRQSISHPRVWFGEPALGELPPVSWGGGHDREDLMQDRLHAQNRTWSDDSSFYTVSSEGSHHSFISLSDDDDREVNDRGEESLLELLEHTEAPEPVEPFHREPRGWASFPPGSRAKPRARSNPTTTNKKVRLVEFATSPSLLLCLHKTNIHGMVGLPGYKTANGFVPA